MASSAPMSSPTSTGASEPLKSPATQGNLSQSNPDEANPYGTNPYGTNHYSSPVVDQHPNYSGGRPSNVSRENIRTRLLGPGIGLIVANSIALLGGLIMLLGAIMNLVDGRGPAEEALGPFGAAFYVVIMSSVSLAGGIAMVSLKNRRLAFTGSITSILNGLCCCIYPIAFGIWALVVLLDHDVQNHYK